MYEFYTCGRMAVKVEALRQRVRIGLNRRIAAALPAATNEVTVQKQMA
ncbi:hypothetical protein [Glycomyces buryatensis]|nr:hypothetical protein [Glycomyces buryatensis]